jgi:glycosyltransferase involved in cell wall biosynthesis
MNDNRQTRYQTTQSEICVQRIDEYPRVLVISPNAINPMAGGGGVLMSNLFSTWPREQLALIYSLQQHSSDPDLCTTEYRLYPRITARPKEWVRRGIDYCLDVNESLDGVSSLKVPSRLWRWIKEFDPQVLYSHLGPLYLTRLTNLIATEINVPLVVHIMDDYIVDWPVNGVSKRKIFPISNILHALNKREFLRSLAIADERLAISHQMAAVYQERYGFAFGVVHNGISPNEWPPTTRDITESHGSFRVLYSGGIAENNNLKSLQQIRNAVIALANRGIGIEMEISSPLGSPYHDVLEYPPVVTFTSAVPRARLPQRLAEFDLLVIPYNFDPGAIRLFQLSWPTKLPEYMMSGTPILLYAPAGMAFVEYARQQGCAFIVDKMDQTEVEVALQRLVENAELRQHLSKTARDVAIRDEDNGKTRQSFQQILLEKARQSRRAIVS